MVVHKTTKEWDLEGTLKTYIIRYVSAAKHEPLCTSTCCRAIATLFTPVDVNSNSD